MQKQTRQETWRRVTSFILPQMRGTLASGSGRILIPTEPLESESRRHWKKPLTIRMGTLQYNTLKWIWQGGEEGRRYRDIQLYMLGGEENVARGTQSKRVMDYDYNTHTEREVSRNPFRGHYSTWLSYYMPNFCTKTRDGRWRLNDKNLIQHFTNLQNG